MARPKLGETDTERMQLKITAAEIASIDDWRFANRVPSRSEAMRRLCQIGLAFESADKKFESAAAGVFERLEALTLLLKNQWEMTKSEGEEVNQQALGSLVSAILSAADLVKVIASVSVPAQHMRSEGNISDLLQKADSLITGIEMELEEGE